MLSKICNCCWHIKTYLKYILFFFYINSFFSCYVKLIQVRTRNRLKGGRVVETQCVLQENLHHFRRFTWGLKHEANGKLFSWSWSTVNFRSVYPSSLRRSKVEAINGCYGRKIIGNICNINYCGRKNCMFYPHQSNQSPKPWRRFWMENSYCFINCGFRMAF